MTKAKNKKPKVKVVQVIPLAPNEVEVILKVEDVPEPPREPLPQEPLDLDVEPAKGWVAWFKSIW